MKKFTSAQKHRIAKILVTFCTIIVISTVCFMIPLRPSVSVTEKRELAKFPEFSFSEIFNGNYFSDISKWFSDTVPFRDTLMGFNSAIQNFLGTDGAIKGFDEGGAGDDIPDPVAPGNEETLPYIDPDATDEDTQKEEPTIPPDEKDAQHVDQMGSVLVVDNAAFEYYYFVQSASDNYARTLNTAAARFPDHKVYATMIPKSIDITLNQKVRKNLNVSDQKTAINYILGSTSDKVIKYDCYDNMMMHRNEYLYFRTDHHWTALGAYYCYQSFCEAKGITPLDISDFEVWSFEGFLGTLYNESGSDPALKATPDRVDAYKPPCNYSMTITDKNGYTNEMPLLYDETDAPASLKYGTFICGDNPLSTITNADKPDGETCVVIKESFGNAFVPFLVYHYKTVYVIDYRHYSGSLSGFLSSHQVDDIIFCNNVSMASSSSLVSQLANFVAG